MAVRVRAHLPSSGKEIWLAHEGVTSCNLAKYETWCFPSILVKLCNIGKVINNIYLSRLIVQGVAPPFILCNCVLVMIAADNE